MHVIEFAQPTEPLHLQTSFPCWPTTYIHCAQKRLFFIVSNNVVKIKTNFSVVGAKDPKKIWYQKDINIYRYASPVNCNRIRTTVQTDTEIHLSCIIVCYFYSGLWHVSGIALFLLFSNTPCPDRQHFGRNFDKFRQLFIIFLYELSWQSVWLKNCKMSHQYLHDDVIVTSLKNVRMICAKNIYIKIV